MFSGIILSINQSINQSITNIVIILISGVPSLILEYSVFMYVAIDLCIWSMVESSPNGIAFSTSKGINRERFVGAN